MSTDQIRPTTLAGIKRLAKTIKRKRGISQAKALDAAAQSAGCQNFRHARKAMAPDRPTAPLPTPPTATADPPPATSQPASTPNPPPADVSQPAAAQAPSYTSAGVAPERRPFTTTAYRERLRDQIRSDENTLRAIRDGRITGMGYETGPHNARAAYEADQAMRDGYAVGIDYSISFSNAASLAREMQRLERRIEQNRTLLRMDEAK